MHLSPYLFEEDSGERCWSNLELVGMVHQCTEGRLVLRKMVTHHQDNEAKCGFILEADFDEVVGV